nr:hypothetical protein GCM10020185_82200 [Pseudomonas brassicacearum subsp. brassicacearum]
MLHDYAGIAFAMIVGGEGTLPVYAALLWVTLGNGMRFGSRYLALATVIALSTLVLVFWLTPFWHTQPYMFLMLIVTTIVVPAYAHIFAQAHTHCLRRSHFGQSGEIAIPGPGQS